MSATDEGKRTVRWYARSNRRRTDKISVRREISGTKTPITFSASHRRRLYFDRHYPEDDDDNNIRKRCESERGRPVVSSGVPKPEFREGERG